MRKLKIILPFKFIHGLIVMLLMGLSSLALLFLTYLLRPDTNCRKNISGFYAEGKNSLDTIYIGSSAAYYGWEPLHGFYEHGFTSYNLGTDALQPQVIKYEVREILKTQAPKLLMIELRPFIYGSEISAVDGIKNMERVAPFRNVCDNLKISKNRYDLIHNEAPTIEPEWTYHFDLSKYHTLLSQVIKKENWKYLLNQKHLYSKGFFYHHEGRYIDLFIPEDMTKRQPVDKDVELVLRDLLDTLKSECPDTQVLFILMPYGAYMDEGAKANYLFDIISEYGYDYFNSMLYVDDMGLDHSKDFRDSDHLNIDGANKFSQYFADYLANNYELPDHRTDNAYKDWFDDYNTWSLEINDVEVMLTDY